MSLSALPKAKGRTPLKKLLVRIKRIPTLVAIGLIVFYRMALSPLLPPSCRFIPTCSEYGLNRVQAVWVLQRVRAHCKEDTAMPPWRFVWVRSRSLSRRCIWKGKLCGTSLKTGSSTLSSSSITSAMTGAWRSSSSRLSSVSSSRPSCISKRSPIMLCRRCSRRFRP